jgi:2-polyprenyl-3-methyl-5-hydroxy-6-metoxy-1,4-benzoquinol methylase
MNIEIDRSELFQVKIYRAAAKLAKTQNVKSVLDLGCGYPTKLLKYIGPVAETVTGVDLFSVIKTIPELHRGRWIACDLNEGKLDLGKKFDMIISADVIEHLSNPDALLTIIKCHSIINTVILLSTPDAESTMKQQDGRPANIQHKREWKMSEFVRYLSASGFDVIDFGCYIETNGSYPYIADYFLVRVKNEL